MISRITIVLIALCVGASAMVFELKDSVRDMHREIAAIDRQIADEKAHIRTLQADWAHVSRPKRLVQLAHEVGMVRAGVRHVMKLDHIGRRAMLEMAGYNLTVPLSETTEGIFRVKPISLNINRESWQ